MELSFILRIVMIMTFLLSGIFINCIQFVLYVTLRYVNIKWYRKVNYYLIYTCWAQLVAMAEWWSHTSVRITFPDKDSAEKFAKENCFLVCNHRYEIDWLMAWLIVDKFYNLANSKSFAKKSLRWMPVVGWGWVFAEFLFLERNWEKDSHKIGETLDRLISYDDPVLILTFAEGTRFTDKKYEASMEFARQKGLKTYKYHLLPRVKGFAYSIKHLKKICPNAAFYNVQLAFDDDSDVKPTFSNLLKGLPCRGDVYIKRTPIEAIPTDTDEAIASYLYDLYEEKDKLVDYYKLHKKFPGKVFETNRRLTPLLNLLFWTISIGITMCVALWKVFTSQNMVLITVTLVILSLAGIVVCIMIRSTKASKGSKYGISNAKPLHDAKVNESVRQRIINGNSLNDTKTK